MSQRHPLVAQILAEEVAVVETPHAGGYNQGLHEAAKVVERWLKANPAPANASADVGTGPELARWRPHLMAWREHFDACERCSNFDPCADNEALVRAVADEQEREQARLARVLGPFAEKLEARLRAMFA